MLEKHDETYTVMSSAGPLKLEHAGEAGTYPPNTSENAMESQEVKDTEEENRYIIT